MDQYNPQIVLNQNQESQVINVQNKIIQQFEALHNEIAKEKLRKQDVQFQQQKQMKIQKKIGFRQEAIQISKIHFNEVIINHPGIYNIQIADEIFKIMIDVVEGGIWMRLHYKLMDQIYPMVDRLMSIDVVKDLIEFSTAIGISDDPETINRENSWLLRNWKFEKSNESSIKKMQTFKNISNGFTPTGTDWHSDYEDGYFQIYGQFETFGHEKKGLEGTGITNQEEENRYGYQLEDKMKWSTLLIFPIQTYKKKPKKDFLNVTQTGCKTEYFGQKQHDIIIIKYFEDFLLIIYEI
ncbi:hypothetical protein pb186bvf_013441 [Paramecium bursaria]